MSKKTEKAKGLKDNEVGQSELMDGLEAKLRAASQEIRNLWVDIDEAARLINEGKKGRAVGLLVRSRNSSAGVALKGGF